MDIILKLNDKNKIYFDKIIKDYDLINNYGLFKYYNMNKGQLVNIQKLAKVKDDYLSFTIDFNEIKEGLNLKKNMKWFFICYDGVYFWEYNDKEMCITYDYPDKFENVVILKNYLKKA